MSFIWTNKIDGKDDVLSEDINNIAQETIRLDKAKADIDLSNVSDDDLKAKLEKAGIGTGTDTGEMSEQIKEALENKVDKVEGKGLSSNDYTDTDKGNVELAIARTEELNQDLNTLQFDVREKLPSYNEESNALDATKFDYVEGTFIGTFATSGNDFSNITTSNGTSLQEALDNIEGTAGQDGVSATHSWNGTTLTITSASGTSSADLKGDKGDKGDTGGRGQDGTSITVKSISESTVDGGNNVITFSDGKTLTVKNGSKGSTGAAGKDGYTPVKGTDYFTEADKSEFIAEVKTVCVAKNQGAENIGKILVVGTDGNLTLMDMPEGGASGDVTGVLDESNNILLSGNLADGTYTLKWLNNEGEYVDAGTIEVGAIPEPEPDTPKYTNLLPLSVDADGNDYVGTNGEDGYKVGYKMSSSTGSESANSEACCSGFIPVSGMYDIIRIKNITLSSTNAINNIVFYDSNKAYIYGAPGTAGAFTSLVNVGDDGVYSLNPSRWTVNEDVAFFRFSCGVISDETIVTVNEEIV